MLVSDKDDSLQLWTCLQLLSQNIDYRESHSLTFSQYVGMFLRPTWCILGRLYLAFMLSEMELMDLKKLESIF